MKRSKLGPVRTLIYFAAALLAAGCGRSKVDPAEQKALARHHQDVLLRRALRGEIQGPEGARLFKALRFINSLARNRQLPGPTREEKPRLLSVRGEVTPDGPYFFTQEFQITTQQTNYGYELVQTYSNGDFQLEKAWHSDAKGKDVKQYPMKPPPPMAGKRAVFLGPRNPGAEIGWAEWFNGTLGAGVVERDSEDPATGFNCFQIGITNANPAETNHADLRSEIFLLGPAANGKQKITFSFTYRLLDKIKEGDRILVYLRFYDAKTNYLDQNIVYLGSNPIDSRMTTYRTLTTPDLIAPARAAAADVVVGANIDFPWTSGIAQFDDFSVITMPAEPSRKVAWISGIVVVCLGLAVLLVVLAWRFARGQGVR